MRGRIRPGPDPDFPVLDEYQRYTFPVPGKDGDGIVALGGNLSPGMLLSAYEQGIFPWYNPEDPVLWHSPDPRFVIFPENLHISKSMNRLLKKSEFEFVLDRDFEGVIRNCAAAARPGQDGTWITDDMISAYCRLHRLGWAHSAETYHDGELAGGCYGIRLGDVFFGESMFAKMPNASKAAFLPLARLLFSDGVAFIDCQVPTQHLRSLGGMEIHRGDFLALLKSTLSRRWVPEDRGNEAVFYGKADAADRRGNWGTMYPDPYLPALQPGK
ncbi:leucyl/phenylalanyl-tRNA--protein transferase [Breznakiella homolactica]|uniref:Leucyl/phenylalanyl-tRNA--protein transferase n=1 Tax=Breznakiella homolactica TaxID=2798577 RepID=A0A7T8B8Z8_9SPIR|nr:leucyl/phenylalanyl-tRNA--protein transferase [Breznakiella homolactica]QQO07922.1 leucyl/phenylalanyl-tRNA--protein transferase [Breznakiella homolactica]